jgi:hypothetical protein
MNEPLGIISVGTDGLARIISECPDFQQRVGKDTAPSALRKVYRQRPKRSR